MLPVRDKKRRGVSLTELLVVVCIMAVLVALLLVGIQRARASADRASTVNNLQQLGVATYSYLTIKNCFPSENAPSSSSNSGGIGAGGPGTTAGLSTSPPGTNPSFYQLLLPYMEQKNAQATTAISGYLDPGRRTVAVGAKRDFGYAASNAYDTQGPSILDYNSGVRQADVLNGLGSTYLLTSVWIDPKDYTGGDPTDIGWAQKLNSRMYGGTVKRDGDSTATIQYLGGPYASTLPTLFADGHVENIPYSSYSNRWSFQAASGSTDNSSSGSGSPTTGTGTGTDSTSSTPSSFSSQNPGYVVYYINGQQVPAFVHPWGGTLVNPGDTVQVVIYGDPYKTGDQNYSGGGYTGAQAGWGNNLNQYTAGASITSSLSNNTNGQLTQQQVQTSLNQNPWDSDQARSASGTYLPNNSSQTGQTSGAYGQGHVYTLVAYNTNLSSGEIWDWRHQVIYSSDSGVVTGNNPITLTVKIPPSSLNNGSFQLDFVTGPPLIAPGYNALNRWIDSVVVDNVSPGQ